MLQTVTAVARASDHEQRFVSLEVMRCRSREQLHRQRLRQTRQYGRGFGSPAFHGFSSFPRLLRARRERPRRPAAKQRDEVASIHSNTSSARLSSDGGTVSRVSFASGYRYGDPVVFPVSDARSFGPV